MPKSRFVWDKNDIVIVKKPKPRPKPVKKST